MDGNLLDPALPAASCALPFPQLPWALCGGSVYLLVIQSSWLVLSSVSRL